METFKKDKDYWELRKAEMIANNGSDTNMKREEIEKIEVAKDNGSFYYTGILRKDADDPDWVIIMTTRGERLKFRKEQIQQRRAVDTKGVDTNEGRKEGNKDLSIRD
jgi:hypothetical protein